MEIQVIAERIRSKDYWDMDSCIELCKLAGLEEVQVRRMLHDRKGMDRVR